MRTCPVCRAAAHAVFRARVLDKHDVQYFRCAACGFLCTEDAYWLDEAYGEAIAAADTGILQRNLSISVRLASLLYCSFERRGAYVDVAGGYGLLVRLMRDLGFDFYWDDKHCRNLAARGFECERADAPVTAVTAFEVLEHVPDPVAFIDAAMKRFGTRTLIFTTELYEGDAAPGQDWWYYAFATGQHISFFQRRTLESIAAALGLRFVSLNGLHVLTERPLRNEGLARLATGPLALPLAAYVRHRQGSKTLADHRRCLQR